MDENSQNELLKKMDSTIENMKVHCSKKILPFQTFMVFNDRVINNMYIILLLIILQEF